MKKHNIGIIDINQHVPGVGGVETVGYLLKNELTKNGYYVSNLFFTQKSEKSGTDIHFPCQTRIDCKENIEFLNDAIEKHQIEILIVQGGYKEELLKLCIEAKRYKKIKLIYPIHFHPLMVIKEFDDYQEKYIQERRNVLIRTTRQIICKFKRYLYTKKHMKFIKEDWRKPYLDNIDAITTLNNEYTRIVKSFHRKNSNKFHTIPNPIITDRQDGAIKKENIILFVGRLTAQKRLDRILHIWSKLYAKNPEWKFVVVGDGEYAGKYKQQAQELQLENIEFVGQQISEEYFKRSRIVCMASSHEAQPMVLIEAQLWGCVPIAYNSFEAATDIIQSGHNGLLVTPFKEKEYTKALRALITDNEMRERLAYNGKEFIKKFDSKVIVKEWIRLFNNL